MFADGPTAEVLCAEVVAAVYDTPVEVAVHPTTGRPHAVFLRKRESGSGRSGERAQCR